MCVVACGFGFGFKIGFGFGFGFEFGLQVRVQVRVQVRLGVGFRPASVRIPSSVNGLLRQKFMDCNEVDEDVASTPNNTSQA
jgi:hypothetical protein